MFPAFAGTISSFLGQYGQNDRETDGINRHFAAGRMCASWRRTRKYARPTSAEPDWVVRPAGISPSALAPAAVLLRPDPALLFRRDSALDRWLSIIALRMRTRPRN